MSHRADTARGRRQSDRYRGRASRVPQPVRACRVPSGTMPSVVRFFPRNSQEPCVRETRLVCLPCQPMPARSANGFSITGAVSTNTFTAGPKRDTMNCAIDFYELAPRGVVVVWRWSA